MLGDVCLRLFPSGSLYASWYKSPRSHRETSETHDESEVSSLLPCHIQKIRNSPDLGRSSHLQQSGRNGKVGYGEVGKSGFSGYARRKILQAGAVLDTDYLPRHLLFLTLTLPGSTNESMKAIAAWSGFLIHRLKAWVNKFLPKREEIWVWERQKRGALHLHWVFPCLCSQVEERIRKTLKAEWIRLLETVSRLAGCDLFERFDGTTHRGKKLAVISVERVRLSVARYLAKYLSKEASSPSGFGTDGREFLCPSRWYGVSRCLHEKIRSRTKEIRLAYLSKQDWLKCYEDVLSLLSSFASWCQSRKHTVGIGRSIYGCIEKEATEDLWMTLEKVVTAYVRDLSASSLKKVTSLLSLGMTLMQVNTRLRKRFYSERSVRARELEQRYLASQPMSQEEALYLLTFLWLSCGSYQQHVAPLSGLEKRWYSTVRAMLLPGEAQSSGQGPSPEPEKVAHDPLDAGVENPYSGTRLLGRQLDLFPLS